MTLASKRQMLKTIAKVISDISPLHSAYLIIQPIKCRLKGKHWFEITDHLKVLLKQDGWLPEPQAT